MTKNRYLLVSAIVLIFSACKPNEPKKIETISMFTKGYVAYYGDIRNVGTHVLSLDIYTSKLSLDSTGTSYAGLGKNLFFDDIYISSAHHTLTDGEYVADSTGVAFTFIPGKNNDGISSGAYLASITDTQIAFEYLSLGKFLVQTKGDSTIIDFDLETERGDEFKAQFRGILGWHDMLPTLVKGRQILFGNRYDANANNYLVQFASIGIDFNSDKIATSGEELVIEFNTEKTDVTGIVAGKYTVAPLLEKIEDLKKFTANTITPYFVLTDETNVPQNFGSWHTSYTDMYSLAIQSGYADVSLTNNTYTIDYHFNTNDNNPIIGTYTAALDFVDTTKPTTNLQVPVKAKQAYLSQQKRGFPKKLFRKK